MERKNSSRLKLPVGAFLLFFAAVCLGGCVGSSPDGLPAGTSTEDDYHPEGWGGNTDHGAEFSSDYESCVACHGKEYDGGISGISCDSCHGHAEDYAAADRHGAEFLSDPESCRLCHGEDFKGSPLAGSCNACHGHDEDYAAGDKHGYDFYKSPTQCRGCHGDDLTGGAWAVSCDLCHSGGSQAWRGDCTFCHGGLDNNSGVPPPGIHGETESGVAAVGAHTAHVTAGDFHAAFSCDICHLVPQSFDDEGHVDGVEGAEITFGALAGGGAGYDSERAACSSVYCHGDGRDSLEWTSADSMACDSCHGARDDPEILSGRHAGHVEFCTCNMCHFDVISPTGEFIDRALHINGTPDVQMRSGAYDSATGTCTNACHHKGTWNWW